MRKIEWPGQNLGSSGMIAVQYFGVENQSNHELDALKFKKTPGKRSSIVVKIIMIVGRSHNVPSGARYHSSIRGQPETRF